MSQQRTYYFDNNATTRVAPEVIEAMLPFLTDLWGNASSAYQFGHQVKKHLDQARAKLAALINADPKEIVFTSCGTESNNTAIHSALALSPGKRHVVTTTVEHSANIKYGEFLQRRGYEVTYLPVESDGSLDLHVRDLFDGENDASLVVRPHDGDDGGIRSNREVEHMEIEGAIRFHWQVGDFVASALEEFAVFDVRRMFDGGGDDVTFARTRRERAMNRSVVALGAATGEDDFLRVGVDERSELSAGIVEMLLDLIPELVGA